LKELFETGASAKVGAALHRRAIIRLTALAQPGFDFHPLQGRPQRYSIHVNGPWCITFEWVDGKALRVDLEQYH
jgi:proteic killer suppression protein